MRRPSSSALSQVSKLFGVPMGRSEHFINDIVGVLKQIGDTHLPTLAMGVLAIAIMWRIKKYAPKLPGVLIAVVVTTLLSWSLGFERNAQRHARADRRSRTAGRGAAEHGRRQAGGRPECTDRRQIGRAESSRKNRGREQHRHRANGGRAGDCCGSTCTMRKPHSPRKRRRCAPASGAQHGRERRDAGDLPGGQGAAGRDAG